MSAVNSIRLLFFCLVTIVMVNIFPRPAFSETTAAQTVEVAAVEIAAGSDVDTFTYNPAGRRDPFTPLVTKVEKTTRVVVSKPRGPLQQYELTQFRLVAVLVIKGRPMAMVKAPDGKSYPVKVGDEIGRYEGKVANIETKVTEKDKLGKRIETSPDRIVVEETVRNNETSKQSVEYRYLTM